ncbi:MAG: hypothetical protein R2712_10230 [Vicinamibacterales bacterium]
MATMIARLELPNRQAPSFFEDRLRTRPADEAPLPDAVSRLYAELRERAGTPRPAPDEQPAGSRTDG